MAGNKIYEDTVYQIINLLKQGDLYPKYVESIKGGKNAYSISQVYTKKNYSTEWIDTLEDCVVALDTIVRNPRKFIVIEEDIVDISLARSISVESVKHLSQHTNLISSVTKDGMVIPSKILNTSKEESFEIYENRFIYTLLLKIRDYIDIRSNAIKNALMQSGELGVDIESEFAIDKNKVSYHMTGSANFPFDAVVKRSGSGVTDLERINRISSIINDFLSSPFAREMRSCALVRPPIQRTNVILKDPNFKKALVLWQFIETSEKVQFKIETSTETMEMNPLMADKFRAIVYLNTVLMQSIAGTHEASDSVEQAKKKERETVDEYVTKNIDDFVPDDFPTLKMDLAQIRTIFKRIPTERAVTASQINKLTAALDRVIRQYRINQQREDSITRQKLIEKQLEEEKQAKLLALREQKDAERKERAERARRRLEAKKAEEERQAELKRLEEERIEFERQKAEAARERQKIEAERARIEEEDRLYWEQFEKQEGEKTAIYEEKAQEATKLREEAQAVRDKEVAELEASEKALEESRRAHVEMAKQEAIVRMEQEKKREILQKLAEQERENARSIEIEKGQTIFRIREESKKFWADLEKSEVELGIRSHISALDKQEQKEIDALAKSYREELDKLAEIENKFSKGFTIGQAESLAILNAYVQRIGSDEEVDRLIDQKTTSIRKEVRIRRRGRAKEARKEKRKKKDSEK